jgi:uncharacterized low-complexity protein
MAKKTELKAVAAALGTTFAVTLAVSPLANAAENPFGVTQFQAGYMVAGEEGKCGGDKGADAKGAEGKCGGEKAADDKGAEGKCGGEKAADDKGAEGKCGGN